MVGIGYDIHRLKQGETLILGGVSVPSPAGTVAHSDGDVLAHAIIDALLGAASLGDIGDHFPDTDEKYKNANSIELLIFIHNFIKNQRYKIVNIDTTIVLEKPKLAHYKSEIRANLAKALELDMCQVSVKATTNERLGNIGNNEGIAALAVCQLDYLNK